LIGFVLFSFQTSSKLQTPVITDEMRQTIEPSPMNRVKIQKVFENLSDDEVLNLLTELEGTEFLIEINDTFFADEMELLEIIEIITAI